MFYRRILTSLLLIQEIIIVRSTKANILPIADTFSSNLRIPAAAAAASADAAAGLDEDDDYTLIVSRGRDILTSTQTQTGHYRDITVTLTAFNETFILDLKLNTYLLGSTYIEKAVTNSGEIYNDVDHVMGHCYYTGKVRNRSQSTAAVSTCKGITGYFTIGNVSYHIEPKSDDLSGRHRVFRNRDDDKTIFRCGTDDQFRWMSGFNSSSPFGRSNHRMKRAFLYPQDEDKIDKIVEVYVANAKSQYVAQSNDVNAVFRRTKDIVNIASLDYQPLGIYLVLVGVEVWTDRDQFTINESNVDGALSSWYTYRQNSINPYHYNDNGVLINNVAFYRGVVGKAIVGSMCSNQYSGSIVSDLSSQPAAAGATLAHEMGHNFGQQHDTDNCSCSDPFANNRCIMYPSSNANRPATKWSACSLATFTTSFSQGLDICLYNIPQTIFQSSSSACGNGIVEDGEQCDCGNAPSSECSTTCCNNVTCQLTASAACAYGRCCDISRCQLKSSGTECRSKSNDCDLTESCNGVDARCPTDTYKPDGTDCTNLDSAYCYQGQCQSYRSQCELLWGPGTQVSNNICYTNFNTAGKHYGNCGLTWGENAIPNYIPCDANNVMCGKLQCQNTDSNKLYYYQSYYLLSSASVDSSSCHSVIFDFGTGTPDPGLVPNGAKCGDQQMCVNQRCIAVIIYPVSTSTTTTSTSRTTTTTSTTTTTNPTTTTSASTSTSSTTTLRPTSPSSTSKLSTSTTTTSTSRTTTTTSTKATTKPTTTTSTSTAAPVPTTAANIPTTAAPIPTTAAPIPTTAAPIPTTAAPIPTTAAPIPTTAAPIPTTAAPIPTTAAPIPTTAAPIPTTAVPIPTTAAPIPTTAAPIATTAAPIPTTAVPIPNTAAPIPTTAATIPRTVAPIPSTAASVATTAAPTPTTVAPMSTTAAHIPSTAAPIATTAAPIPTTAAPIPTTAATIPTTVATKPITTVTIHTTATLIPTTAAPIPTTAAPISITAVPLPTTAASTPSTAATVPTTVATIPTTTAPIPTTAAPVATTAAPIPTTVAPMSTTAAPIPSTAAPIQTTVASIPTGPARKSTTADPIATTAAPIHVPITATPIASTAAPIQNTAAPILTTAAPIPTTAAPGPTKTAPTATTAAPGTTTAAPIPTTAAPVPTTPERASDMRTPSPTTNEWYITTSNQTIKSINSSIGRPNPSMTSSHHFSTPSNVAPTVNLLAAEVILGIILGSVALIASTVLLCFCCNKFFPLAFNSCCQLFVRKGPMTSALPVESFASPVFSRGAMPPVQTKLRWVPVERVMRPPPTSQTQCLHPDWSLLRRPSCRQPIGRVCHYTNDVCAPYRQPCSSTYCNMKIPQIVIR